MVDDFMFCHQMQCRKTSFDVFNILNDFFSQSQLSGERCVGICTNSAASMTDQHLGAIARIREKVPNIIQMHCMIHREVFVVKHLAQSLSGVLSSCMKIVNTIKACPLHSQMFSKLCDELSLKHSILLLHAEVHWLSQGKIVKSVFELREELSIFLQEHNTDLASLVADEIWLGKLAYLADIFDLLNQLNLSLQGRNANILLSQNKITAFIKKFNLWKARINDDVMDMLPVLCDNIANKSLVDKELIYSDIEQHLKLLSEHFRKYFLKETYDNFDWILNSFVVAKTDLSGHEEEELAELLSDRTLMISFNQKALASFWLSVLDEYPLLLQKATKISLPFVTTCMCETAFSTLTSMKTKYRSRLVAEFDLWVCLSQIALKIDKLCSKKQPHPLH